MRIRRAANTAIVRLVESSGWRKGFLAIIRKATNIVVSVIIEMWGMFTGM